MTSKPQLKLIESHIHKKSFMLVISRNLPKPQQVKSNHALMVWFRLHTNFGETAELAYAYMREYGLTD